MIPPHSLGHFAIVRETSSARPIFSIPPVLMEEQVRLVLFSILDADNPQ